MQLSLFATMTCVLLCTGCAGIGARTVTADRFDYTSALSDSWKSQMLINVVKVRYGDTPVFLDVSSVIESYELTQSASAGYTWQFTPATASGATAGVAGVYANRPTITYSPMSGEKFAKSLMSPIPPAHVLSLIQSGYPADFVLRFLVQSVNGLRNRHAAGFAVHPASPQFLLLAEKLRQIQASGAVGLRVEKLDKMESSVIVLRHDLDEQTAGATVEVRKMLGLDPQATEFSVVYGLIPANDKQIALLTRSMLQVLQDYASYIEVPEADVAQKRVGPTLRDASLDGAPVATYVNIRSSSQRPHDAFVAVPYRNHWFWIDDRDLPSKELFSFLMFAFTLVETSEKQPAPTLSLPVR